jgi:hypothetical protein
LEVYSRNDEESGMSIELLESLKTTAASAASSAYHLRSKFSNWVAGMELHEFVWNPGVTEDIKVAHCALISQERSLWDLHDSIKGRK